MTQDNTKQQVAIVGAGASGLAAAIAAARNGAQVRVFEATDKIGTPILRSGNGRCNFSNAHISATDYCHPEFVGQLVTADASRRIQDEFSRLGLSFYEEDGRLYPHSRVALSVLNVLLTECRRLGVTITTKSPVRRLTVQQGAALPFTLYTDENGVLAQVHKVIWAAGGSSMQERARELDLAHSELTPVLTPLSCDNDLLWGLSGLRAQVRVSLVDRDYTEIAREYGELLLRDYGVSGIAVFNLSRLITPDSRIVIDFLPQFSFVEAVEFLERYAQDLPQDGQAWAHALDGVVHPHLGRRILELLQPRGVERVEEAFAAHRKKFKGRTKPKERLSHQDTSLIEVNPVAIEEVVALLKNFEMRVTGRTELVQAQVVRGGVELREVNPLTLECNRIPGLHICGEALDVDGKCGGYNLSWAWISGAAAGAAAAGGTGQAAHS